MPRTRRRFLEPLTGGLLLMAGLPAQAVEGPRLHCRLQLLPPARAKGSLRLRLVLGNRGAAAVQVLEWATPFEGWMGPFVSVWHEGRELPYRGAMVKRGDPGREEYLLIRPGQSRQATVELADAYDLSLPGSYELRPQMQLADVVVAPAQPPRTRDALQPLPLRCPSLRFALPAP